MTGSLVHAADPAEGGGTSKLLSKTSGGAQRARNLLSLLSSFITSQ